MKPFEVPEDLQKKLIARRGRLHAYESFEGTATALVVVDMQNFFIRDGGPMAAPAALEIVPKINRLAAAVREAGGLVVWIQAEVPDPAVDDWGPMLELFHAEARRRRHALLNRQAEGFKLWSELDVKPSDSIVVKRRYSAFIQGASDLEDVLRRRGIETVLITGVATNVCCESTGRDCMMRGFRTILVSDANASFSEAEHEAALLNFITYFGDVQPTEDVVARLAVQSPAVEVA
jgi:ureidoacrylate peracid hydrolase